MQRVIDLLVGSFQAVGQNDSAKYYLSIYQGMFPYLDVEKYGINTSYLKPPITQKENLVIKVSYVIQIGAFSSLKNAKRLKLQANQIGHEVEIVQVETKDRTLNAVRVVNIILKPLRKSWTKLKRKLGVDFRVLYRPVTGKYLGMIELLVLSAAFKHLSVIYLQGFDSRRSRKKIFNFSNFK